MKKFWSDKALLIGLSLISAFTIFFILAYRFEWEWTGFASIEYPKGSDTELKRHSLIYSIMLV